jgi:dTDP-4-amino-4,6-dideoxygalactose transaminase
MHAGLNSKMMEICAIIGIENLKTFPKEVEERKAVALIYNQLCEHYGIETMRVMCDVDCNYLYFPIILKQDATEFVRYMADNGVQVRRYYTACHTLTAYKCDAVLPYTDSIKDRIVALPIHSDMTEQEINDLFNLINSYK